MKAIVRTKYGSPDVLELREIEKVSPGDDQVLVNVHAASVNPLDWHMLRGRPYMLRLTFFGFPRPKQQVLGADFSGTVEGVGKNVKRFKIGDDVFGSSLGSFAEYLCVHEKALELKPANLSFEQAAAVSMAGLTALQGLRDYGQLREGQEVLVNGASGGVGTFAIQIAKAMGAQVTAVCSGKNLEFVRSLGADDVIDYTKEDFWASGKKYDLILDNALFHSVFVPLRALKPAGSFVLVGGDLSCFVQASILRPFFSRKQGKKIVLMMASIKAADLLFLKSLIEDGKVAPVLDKTYPLSEVPDALRFVGEGHTRGKIVIRVQS